MAPMTRSSWRRGTTRTVRYPHRKSSSRLGYCGAASTSAICTGPRSTTARTVKEQFARLLRRGGLRRATLADLGQIAGRRVVRGTHGQNILRLLVRER